MTDAAIKAHDDACDALRYAVTGHAEAAEPGFVTYTKRLVAGLEGRTERRVDRARPPGPSPSGTSQPNESCEEERLRAERLRKGRLRERRPPHVGNGAPSLNANSEHAVSQSLCMKFARRVAVSGRMRDDRP